MIEDIKSCWRIKKKHAHPDSTRYYLEVCSMPSLYHAPLPHSTKYSTFLRPILTYTMHYVSITSSQEILMNEEGHGFNKPMVTLIELRILSTSSGIIESKSSEMTWPSEASVNLLGFAYKAEEIWSYQISTIGQKGQCSSSEVFFWILETRNENLSYKLWKCFWSRNS